MNDRSRFHEKVNVSPGSVDCSHVIAQNLHVEDKFGRKKEKSKIAPKKEPGRFLESESASGRLAPEQKFSFFYIYTAK